MRDVSSSFAPACPRHGWPFLSAPPAMYWAVMAPICALEIFLIASRSPLWMRGSAGAVLVVSAIAFARGYLRRLIVDGTGARFRRLLGEVRIPWERVRGVGRYVPGGGLGSTSYVYITSRDEPPAGAWDIDDRTIQIQDRPGALEAIQAAWGAFRAALHGGTASLAGPERPDEREAVVLVDDQDCPIGTAGKLEAHRDGGRLHRAFSIFVFDHSARLLLQRRAAGKYHFALRWSNTCCGHPRPGEKVANAASRRLFEEFGFAVKLNPVGSFAYRAVDALSGLTEHEFLHVFVGRYEGSLRPDPAEITQWRWVDINALRAELRSAPGEFTPWMPLALDRALSFAACRTHE